MSVVIGRCVTGLLCVLIRSGSSGSVYVRSGSEITGCNMKCPEDDVTLELYRQCGGEDRTLLERHCYYNHTKSHDSRLHLDTRSGCWKLTPARKEDSCVYRIWCYSIPEYLISSTEIHVLEPVLISNITSNGSWLGEDMAVSVQFSGEESAVTWELDGEPLPERYRLIDDNRTLIIPSVQGDDSERKFRVRITNPVSEQIRDYKITDDPIFNFELHKRRVIFFGLLTFGIAILVVLASIRNQMEYRCLIWATTDRKERAPLLLSEEAGNLLEKRVTTRTTPRSVPI